MVDLSSTSVFLPHLLHWSLSTRGAQPCDAATTRQGFDGARQCELLFQNQVLRKIVSQKITKKDV